MSGRKLTNDTIELRKQFSKNLHEALDDLGVAKDRGRQKWLAKQIGKPQPACSRFLNAKGMPEYTDWEHIAEKVNVNLPWLFFNLGPKRNNHSELQIKLQKRVLKVVTKIAPQKLPESLKQTLVEKLVKEIFTLFESELLGRKN